MSQPQNNGARKAPIFGQPHALDDEEAQSITEMISGGARLVAPAHHPSR